MPLAGAERRLQRDPDLLRTVYVPLVARHGATIEFLGYTYISAVTNGIKDGMSYSITAHPTPTPLWQTLS